MLGFLFILALATSTVGSLYPTYPIKDTVWTAGRTECVTWIDDGPAPKLQELGRLDIELYMNGHVSSVSSCCEEETD